MSMMKIGNFFIRLILSSPLHALMSKNTLLIHFTGRKSGKNYITPVNYSQADGKVWITSQPQRTWWKNFEKHPDVQLTLSGKLVSGSAVILKSGQAAAEGLENFLRPNPNYAKYYQVSADAAGNFHPKDLLKAAESLVVIEVSFE